MKPILQQLRARLQRAAALAYWRVRLWRIHRQMAEIDNAIADWQRATDRANVLIMLDLQRKQQGKVMEHQARARIESLGGKLRPDPTRPTQDTPRRRHYEQCT